MTESPNAPASWRRTLVPSAGLVLLALAAYANGFSGAFLLDDQSSIVRNPSLSRVWPPWAPLFSPSAGGTRGRPFANLSFAANHWLGGLAVQGYHVANVGIHILAGLVLFGIMRRTLRRPLLAPRFASAAGPLAFAVSALWLVHPLTTESVTYLAQRTECLMGLCYLLALYCVIRGAESASPKRWYLLGVAASLLGMATKEVMATAPVVILFYDRTFLAGSFAGALRERWRLYLGLACGWILLGCLMYGVGERGAGLGLGVGSWSYALCESRAIVRYLGLAVWPRPLVFDYGTDLGPAGAAAAPYVAIVLALGACMLLLLRRRPAAGFAVFWILAILAPTSSVVPIVLQPVAEHRMYLPLIAVVALAVTGSYLMLGRWSAILFSALALCLGVLTHERNNDYRSPILMWGDTVSKRPMNARAHCNLGNAYLADHEEQAAMREFNEALRISPDDADTNLDLGVALGNLGRLEEARQHIEKALGANPAIPEASFDLGWLYARSGRAAEALGRYSRAIELRPDYLDAHVNIADLLLKEGRFQEAIPHYERALGLGPPDADLYYNLGYAKVRTGQYRDAVADFRMALELRPSFSEARHNLELLGARGGQASPAQAQ